MAGHMYLGPSLRDMMVAAYLLRGNGFYSLINDSKLSGLVFISLPVLDQTSISKRTTYFDSEIGKVVEK